MISGDLLYLFYVDAFTQCHLWNKGRWEAYGITFPTTVKPAFVLRAPSWLPQLGLEIKQRGYLFNTHEDGLTEEWNPEKKTWVPVSYSKEAPGFWVLPTLKGPRRYITSIVPDYDDGSGDSDADVDVDNDDFTAGGMS